MQGFKASKRLNRNEEAKMEIKFHVDLDQLQSFFEEARKIQEACPTAIETERLILRRQKPVDCISTRYFIYLRETEQNVGSITLINDGEIWYGISEPFQKNGYATEALAKVEEVVKTDIPFYLAIDAKNKASRKVAKKAGFVCKRKRRDKGKITMVFEKK